MAVDAAFMEKLVALCKRRGFIFQSSEIYGGIGGFWDYGPLGVELKRNIKNAWWQDHVTNPPLGPDGQELQMVGLDCSIIMNPKVWEASGHAAGFADPMVDCKKSQGRYRHDHLFVVKNRMDSGANRMYTFQAGDAEGESRARRALAKYEKASDSTSYHVKPLTEIPLHEYHRVVGPDVDEPGTLMEPRQFNLMFETHAGAIKNDANKVFLRPETAQGIFCNFKNVLDTSRVKVPFGIAQIGKAFRNEVNPRNYIFRSREFEQMEIEFFCREEDSMQWYQFWRNQRYNWYVGLGLKSEKLRLRDQDEKELAHYSKACADIEYLFPFSDEFQELEGCAHRGCFDLTQHQTHSGVDLTYFDQERWDADRAGKPPAATPEEKAAEKQLKNKPPYRYLATVIEPSAGADRATLAFLCEAYTEDQKADAKGALQTRVYMRFHPRLAPIKAAFFPLVNKEGMPELAQRLYREAKRHMNVFFDDGGSIGRRYARMDEAGTPWCITIDGDTIKGDGENAGMVTIRDRDTLEQTRVHRDAVIGWLRERVGR